MSDKSKKFIISGALLVLTIFLYLVLSERGKLGVANDLPKTTEKADTEVDKQLVVSEKEYSDAALELVEQPAVSYSKAYTIYQKYISAAESGDSAAKYLVGLALSKCRRGKPPPAGHLDHLAVQPEITEEAIKEIRQNYEQCSKLYALNDGQDLHIIRDAWIENAADDGNVFALVTQAVSHDSVLPESDELLNYLYRAFELSQEDELLRESAVDLVLKYHGKLAYEKSIDFSDTDDLSELKQNWLAWEVLFCNTSDECTENQIVDRLSERYLEDQIINIVESADHLETVLGQGDWAALKLPDY